ncbi:MAG: UbiD family decarboxylase [candidate division KSB1 bacterium]|nr:UbiD family decarboxylase [candidate division KSB1 bacterium]MDZ7275843.1 UbiD family decarboxylase [candidate division KSB1 bacterium]MDZ7287593.1 UbiD family decarboxylase [candidate division KSB1 bacterium]MDZ7306503.1 UbiD family decarboxylase [candidate division KSB1 bacterium]MDZ7350571.1 UbiD family decarboxylase [candidate division KSB1 bacterium]
MSFKTLGDFARHLESLGELHRVKVEVDPELEITEIAVRALREERPALLFENVKGARFPLAINLLASARRIELALGKPPDQLGEELIHFVEAAMPPKPRLVLDHWPVVKRLLAARPGRCRHALSQQVVSEPNLSHLPVQKCWPEDGGRFITLGQVFTHDPRDGRRNVGMYRMQVYDDRTTGMHWQIQKGGGFHYYQAQKLSREFEIAVALGTHPALLLATIAALPEGIDEVMLAGFLRGAPMPMVWGKSIALPVPAEAEFILEGRVPLAETRREGPFGDHFGHYSHAADFPVFHLSKITHRRGAIYPCTVVGKPPMEDKFLGDATQQILGPLARLLHKEIKSIWAYYEAGFHNLLVVSVEQRYQKEAMKSALGLMGTDQLALTKCIVLVSDHVNVRDWQAVLAALRENFDPHYDFVMIPKVPLDTLDFTSFKMNLGSKMILDATMKPERPGKETGPAAGEERARMSNVIARLPQDFPGVLEACLHEEVLLLVKTAGEGRRIIEPLVKLPELRPLKIIAAVSADVDLHSRESYIWGVFTRFDAERDVIFSEQSLHGISPIYRGVMGIDATWKPGYPGPLVMTEEIRERVARRWEEYWR